MYSRALSRPGVCWPLTWHGQAGNLERVAARLAFLFDCDNTLLDNDAAKEEFGRRLEAAIGEDEAVRFWATYEDVRAERAVVDIPATIARFAGADNELRAILTGVFFDFPFGQFLYPGVPRVIEHARKMGSVAVLSDGDQVFQRHKIRASGLEEMVGGAVFVVEHKEVEIPRLIANLRADRYVTVDDKPHLLGALKSTIGAPLTTVFVRQGNYAAAGLRDSNAADLVLDSVADFLHLNESDLLAPSSA